MMDTEAAANEETTNTPPADESREETIGRIFDEAGRGGSGGEQPSAAPRERDNRGRFTPRKTGEEGAAGGEGGAGAQTAAAEAAPQDALKQEQPQTPAAALVPETPFSRAPASWRAEAKAEWDKLPATAKEEVMRREVEIQRALQDTAAARKTIEQLQQVVAPFQSNIQAAGGEPVRMISELLQADHILRHGTQLQKAALVANIVSGFGVDVQALDAALVDGPKADPQAQMMQAMQAQMQQQLAPVQQFIQSQQQAHQQQLVSSIEAFARDPKHKFFDAVRAAMADILDLAAQQGRPVTLEQAYETACWQDPAIRSTLIKEQSMQGAQSQSAAVARAKNAASSVKPASRNIGAPGGQGAGNGRTSREDDIRNAMALLEGTE